RNARGPSARRRKCGSPGAACCPRAPAREACSVAQRAVGTPPKSPTTAARGRGRGIEAGHTRRTPPPGQEGRPGGKADHACVRAFAPAGSPPPPVAADRTPAAVATGRAIARDERPQLHVRAVRVVALQPGPDPRLVVPAVERRVLGAGEVGLELLEWRQGVVDEPPQAARVR